MLEPTLPPLADLLPHLRAGDHITAEYDGGALVVSGELQTHRGHLYLGRDGFGFTVRDRTYPGSHLTAITSAPDAHQRWKGAQQPTWADDPNVAMVDDGEERWIRDYPEELDSIPGTWRCVDSDIAISRSTDELVARGARPVARYITAEPAPEPETCDRDHEPPIGSVVRDRNSPRWQHESKGWRILPSGTFWVKWADLWDAVGPLTLVEDGTNTGAGQ